MTEWQPIDTAPRDGTWVLVWGNGWRVTMAWYGQNPRINKSYWKADEELDDYDLADRQPLPEPPK